jgi:hypothetical protein
MIFCAIWATVDNGLGLILPKSSKLKRTMHGCCRFGPAKSRTRESKVYHPVCSKRVA